MRDMCIVHIILDVRRCTLPLGHAKSQRAAGGSRVVAPIIRGQACRQGRPHMVGGKGPHAHFSQCVRVAAAAVRGFRGVLPVSAPRLLAGPLQQSR